MTIGQKGESPFVQHGVSSLVVNEKPVQVRATSPWAPKVDGNIETSTHKEERSKEQQVKVLAKLKELNRRAIT